MIEEAMNLNIPDLNFALISICVELVGYRRRCIRESLPSTSSS
jgi:hypothetical protein